METLSLLTISLIRAHPSVREFVIPFHPSLVKQCGPNFVSVVDELSQQLVRNGLIERGDIRFNYDFDTGILIVWFPNKHLFLCGMEDDDPDQLTCYFGMPMKPYRTMSEGVGANLLASVNLLGALCGARSEPESVLIHASCVHPLTVETASKLVWPGHGKWELVNDESGAWITLTNTNTN